MSPLLPELNLVGIWTTVRLLLLLLLLRLRHGALRAVSAGDVMRLGCTDYCFNRAS